MPKSGLTLGQVAVYKKEKLLDNFPNMLYTMPERGAVAQMGERINRTDEVRGSSPLSSTNWLIADSRWRIAEDKYKPVATIE